jgi:hypothetical protein
MRSVASLYVPTKGAHPEQPQHRASAARPGARCAARGAPATSSPSAAGRLRTTTWRTSRPRVRSSPRSPRAAVTARPSRRARPPGPRRQGASRGQRWAATCRRSSLWRTRTRCAPLCFCFFCRCQRSIAAAIRAMASAMLNVNMPLRCGDGKCGGWPALRGRAPHLPLRLAPRQTRKGSFLVCRASAFSSRCCCPWAASRRSMASCRAATCSPAPSRRASRTGRSTAVAAAPSRRRRRGPTVRR